MDAKRLLAVIAASAATLLVGCSQFHEHYIFRAGRPGKANYYRVKIDGYTRYTSSQFAAGLYDAEAVDALFGELTGPGKRVTVTSAFAATTSTPPAITDTSGDVALVNSSTNVTTPVSSPETLSGKSLTNQKFVFFLSSNANAFINQIQTYVDAGNTQTAVMTLLFKDDMQKLEASRSQVSKADVRMSTLSTAIANAVTPLGTGDTAKSSDVRDATLEIMALLANRSNTSSPVSFSDIKQAEQWIRDHPQAFRPAGGAL